jgi:hypothetical protein
MGVGHGRHLGAAILTATTVGAKDELGQVQFQVSCTADAQQKFHHAMALYHSFGWKKAQQAFTEIAGSDPKCGMAWWGLAMVAADNPFGWPVSLKTAEGAEAIEKAKQTGAGTPSPTRPRWSSSRSAIPPTSRPRSFRRSPSAPTMTSTTRPSRGR